MSFLEKSKKIFLDFDGVIVDSNNFKELAIEESIFKILGKNKKTIKAINFFNINAGISRSKKLSLFFENNQVSEIMKIYSEKCHHFFLKALLTSNLEKFLKFLKTKNKDIKIYILSGGEKKEIELFLKKNSLISYFDEILASEKSKIDHLLEKEVSKNDIFIGDSKNDLKTSLRIDIKFILMEQYKSLNSFPSEIAVKENFLLKTENFDTLMKYIEE